MRSAFTCAFIILLAVGATLGFTSRTHGRTWAENSKVVIQHGRSFQPSGIWRRHVCAGTSDAGEEGDVDNDAQVEEAPVRPTVIRFFRNQMFNMITIALSTLDIEVKPSRRVHNLLMWLDEREKTVYPSMTGYNPQLRQQTILDYDVSQPDRLPDVLKAESYAFVALPAEAFWNGEVNEENINRGRLCPIAQMPKTGWIHGITLFSKRADAVASWMNGLEISSLRGDLVTRELMLNTDISTQFVVAPLQEAQKREAQIFEKGKSEAAGYHFLSVQSSPDAEEVQGFWLLRQFDPSL